MIDEKLKSEIEKELSSFGIKDISEVEQIDTSGNESYLIKTPTKSYFLRISPDDVYRGRTTEELSAEVEFTDYLAEKGIPINIFLRNDKKEAVLSIDGKQGLVRAFDSGEPTEEPTLKQLELFGSVLGKIHKVSEGYKTTNERSHIWNPKETFKNLLYDEEMLIENVQNGREFFLDLKNNLAEIAEQSELPKGMIHEDLGKRHILFNGGKISGIIDFDRCYYGNLADDLGQAVRGWCFSDSGEFEEIKFKTLMNAYEKERKLNDFEQRYLKNAIKFAFWERALSFALRSIKSKNSADFAFARELLENGNKFNF